MAWWQKKLLRYALARTGLLDDKALDLDKLDITLGKKNVVELKDVGLNIGRIAKLAQLPPSLRIETARVLSLRLTVPADIYQSSIVAEIDGVELTVRLDEKSEASPQEQKSKWRAPTTTRMPAHRKVPRRMHSPPPRDPGGLSESDDLRIPTTEELAKSFLLEKPVQRRRELEASVVVNDKSLEESTISVSSSGDDLGTGVTIGLPGFLANFLQGILDRLQVKIRNVEVKIELEVPGDDQQNVPVTLRLCVGSAELRTQDSHDMDEGNNRTDDHGRKFELFDLSLHLLSDPAVFSELSELPSQSSPTESRQRDQSLKMEVSHELQSSDLSQRRRMSRSTRLSSSSTSSRRPHSSPQSPDAMRASRLTVDADRFADAGDDGLQPMMQSARSDLDIQLGDDNVSWGSRRSRSDAPEEGLWSSMTSEDELPESLLMQHPPATHAQFSGVPNTQAARPRRDFSPFDRHFQSPGSWPRLEESPERRRYQQGPGSWPALEQSQQSLYQPLTPGPAAQLEDKVDNKRTALEASMVDAEGFDTPPEASNDSPDDLAMSRIFTHEEAESMYMSAMTQTSKMHVPGGWSSDDDQNEDQTASPDIQPSKMNLVQDVPSAVTPLEDSLAYGEQPHNTPGNVTPRAQSPQLSVATKLEVEAHPASASRQLLSVDTMTLRIPAKGTSEGEAATESSAKPVDSNMPGGFSTYSENSASPHQPAKFAGQHSGSGTSNTAEESGAANDSAPTSIAIGTVKTQLDMACGRLLYRVMSKISVSLRAYPDPHSGKAESTDEGLPRLFISVQDLELAFKENATKSLHGNATSRTSESLVKLVLQGIHFSSTEARTDIRVGYFATFVGSSCILSFNRHREMMTSVIIDEQTPNIALVLGRRSSALNRPILDVTIQTLPPDILLDLLTVDEAFESFGGLSGVLDVGNSILSESGLANPTSSPAKLAKGVRFEGDPQHSGAGTEYKVNARVGGICTTLRGSTCSVQLQTSTVKAVHREKGTVATMAQLSLTGPYLREDDASSVSVNLSTLRFDYLVTPQNEDLERLLSLLTPSRDKYDNDNDILLDTLFRQRKKGTVLRASIERLEFTCDDWEWVSAVSTLGSELGKLSVVTKYLPEDERPGVLSLVRIKDMQARLPVNERFGALHLSSSDLHCAHVGLPALLALSIGGVKATQADQNELLHTLVRLSGSENSPMVMARLLGDEEEPTVKVKLFNLRVEYSVPVVLALSNLDKEPEAEDIVAELARSVAQLAMSREPTLPYRGNLASDLSDQPTKRMKIDLLIHESAIGLSPRDLPSKALLVLTDARFSTVVPPEDTVIAKLDLNKTGLFVADEVFMEGNEATHSVRNIPGNTATKTKLTVSLSKQGFVSVGSIMAAKAAVRLSESAGARAKTMEMDVSNQLLLLETCADSTQTLLAVMNGLVPPTPPSKQAKYLTEPMTIEDMMASFTGDAVLKPAKQPDMLFDVEEESEDDLDFPLGNNSRYGSHHDDGDDILAESEMTESLYGPLSGVLDDVGDVEDADDIGEFPETAESLLEDDPFEMAISPTDAKMSDAALLREINKQAKPALNGNPVDLGLYEPKDLGYDLCGQHQQAFGGRYRLRATRTSERDIVPENPHPDLPFRLRLRDVHIIWNIYDGYDWQRTREGISQAVERVEAQAEERKARRRQPVYERDEEESVIGDFLFNSIYIGVPSNHDVQELRRQINRNIDDLVSETESVPMSGISRPTTAYSSSGRPLYQRPQRRLKLERGKSHKIAFELKGVSADVVVFPEDSVDLVSSVDVRVKDFEIFDLVPTSTWRKFLTHLSDEPGSREMSKPMLHIELLNIRTLENFAASELAMHVSVLPLRLHVDQDALDFITRFFEFKDDNNSSSGSASEQPFLQRVEVDTVDLRLDYKPKKVDYGGLRSGHTTEFMNFIILEAANIRLKHAIIYGIKGFDPLHKTLNDIWMPDVKRNQLPTVLAGLAPVRSLVNIGSGVRDVIAIPIREYKKDGRIMRSVQKGAFQFGKTTASELARLGAKVAMGTQTLLHGAEGFLTPTSASPGRPSSSRRNSSDQGLHGVNLNEEDEGPHAISAYANQPLGVLSGLRSARKHLEYDLLTARDALIAVQGEILDSSGPSSAAAAVVKHAPTVILRPIIGTSRAVGTALLGVGNQIDRGNIRRIDDKYKRR